MRTRLRTYGIYFLVWTVIGLFFFSQGLIQKTFSRDPTPWWHYLVSWMTGVYVSAALTPAILWLGRRYPIERNNWSRRAALHLVFSVAFSVTELALHAAILPSLRVFPAVMSTIGSTFAFLLIIGFHQNVTTYWSILGIQYAFRYYRGYQERKQHALRLELQAAELKTQLVGAQLSALNMQLQPHFLFNTLNAIMVLVRQQKAREAEEMLSRLSDLLRWVLEDVDAQEAPLRRELEYLDLYLSIEQVRFQDRLRVEISADPAVLDAAVPHLGLQPLVENAIRHGIGRSLAAGTIRISASRFGDTLEIKVRDDGPGLTSANNQQGWGIGLTNTRARLRQLYGDAASIVLENDEPRGAVATMTLPYHAEPAEPHALDRVDR